MERRTLEPGLLRIFRLFVAGRMLTSLLALVAQRAQVEPRVLRTPLLSLLESSLLLLYLTWPELQRRLGKAYLPIAVILASAGPILEHALSMVRRVSVGITGSAITVDTWQLILVLCVPLIVVSWQYSFGSVLFFCGGTALLELVLVVPLAIAGRFRPLGVITLIVLRTLLFVLVGYVVTRLVAEQRTQRRALARANDQLARYAATLEQLTISRERNRMARELHDTLAHSLSAVAVQLEAARSLWDADGDAAREMMTQALGATRAGLHEARRAIQALRATPLEDLGLLLALRSLAESSASRAGVALDLQLPERLEGIGPEVEQGIYRVAAEALENVARHAEAGRVRVRLAQEGGRLTLVVADDGRGFDVGPLQPEGHFGLQGMRERAAMIGGTLAVESRKGEGTQVTLIVEVL